MKTFGWYITSLYVDYRKSKLRFDVNGDCRDIFAYLNEEESEITPGENIPDHFVFWKIRDQYYYSPLKSEELGTVLKDLIKQELKKTGLIWISHGYLNQINTA